MRDITFNEAKELSLKKWEYLKDHTNDMGRICEIIPELDDIVYECGMCTFFVAQHGYILSNTLPNGCYKICPVAINGKNCLGDEHPFKLLKEDNSKKDKLLATRIYNIIKNIDVDKFLEDNPQFKSTRKKP